MIGAGGLGCSLSLTLAGSIGPGSSVTIVDFDVVEISNLHRQFAYTEKMVGLNKSECLVQVCQARNSLPSYTSLVSKVTDSNIDELISNHDVIFDCTDNLSTRILISDSWINNGRINTLISASCVGWCGQVITLSPNSDFCLRCLYGDTNPSESCGQCASQGIMGPVVGIVGNYQYLALIKEIQKQGGPPLSLVDCVTNTTSSLTVPSSCCKCLAESNKCEILEKFEKQKIGKVVSINYEELLALLDTDVAVVDVREPGPFKVFHLNSSVNIPASRFFDVPKGPIIIVCKRGITSMRLGKTLDRDEKVYSLEGGLAKLAELAGLNGIV